MATLINNVALAISSTASEVVPTKQPQSSLGLTGQFKTALTIATNTSNESPIPNEPSDSTRKLGVSDPAAELTLSGLATQLATLSALAQFISPQASNLMQLPPSLNPNQLVVLGTASNDSELFSRANFLRFQQIAQLQGIEQTRENDLQLRLETIANRPLEPVAELTLTSIVDSISTPGNGDISSLNQAHRGSVIPAQIPLISGLTANPQTTAQLSTNPNIPAPIVTSSSTGLPGTQVGDRPLMAGEKYAAIAVEGTRLAKMTRVFGHDFDQILQNVKHSAGGQPTDNLGATANIFPPNNTQVTSPLTSPLLTGNQQAPGSTSTPNTSRLADDIVTQARFLQRADQIEFQLMLDPPELGRVRVHLISSGDEIRGQVIVGDDAVRRMIENQLPELRSRFETAGMNIQHFDVTAERNQSNGNTADLPDDTARNAIQTPMAMQNRSSSMVRSSSSSIDVTV
jgi:hypothetical protein